MKLSIILAVKELDEYIINCVDSVINQNVEGIEVVIIDEELTDNSARILYKYKDINNISVYNYNNKERSVSSSLNFGLNKAKGEYVMFMQASDYLEDGFLNDIMDNLNSDVDLVKFSFSYLDGKVIKAEETHTYEVNNGYELLKELINYKEDFEKLNKYIFNKRILDNKIVLNKGDFYSELTIISYLLMTSKKVVNSELTGYVYRLLNGKNRTGHLNSSRDIAFDVLTKYEYLESLNFSASYDEEKKQYLLNYISNVVINQLNKLNGKDKKQFKTILKNKKVFLNVKKESFLSKLLKK